MNEEMNLAEDTNLADDFETCFSGEEAGQDANAFTLEPENDWEPEEGTSADENPAAEEPKYKVNFLGEEKELPVSELVTAAQKGMNYDHVKSELDSLKSQAGQRDSACQVMEQMAQASGMTMEQYVNLCSKTLEEHQLKRQLDRGVPPDVARRLMELEQRESENRELERYNELLREYPDLKELPDEVALAVASGEHPLTAYRAYENKRLKNELSILKKAEENTLKTTGSLLGDTPVDNGGFLAGFQSI